MKLMRFSVVLMAFLVAMICSEVFAENYDNFGGGAIDRDKWQNREFIRMIDGNSLRLEVRGAPSYSGSYLESAIAAKRSDKITRIAARINLQTFDNGNGANGAARICGRFYNDGTPGDGFEGDIFAAVELGGNASSPQARWIVGRQTDPSSAWGLGEVSSNSFATKVNSKDFYSAEIEWDGQKFTFRLGNEEKVFYPPWPMQGSAHYPDKFLDVFVAPPNRIATVSARFDNVRGWNKNGTMILTDDFSTASIDRTKWIRYEYIRKVENGKLRLMIRSDDGYTNPVENLLIFKDPEDITYMETQVRLTAFQNEGADSVRAGLFGRFLNDGTPGNGYLGDIGAIVGIGGSGSTPEGIWRVIRHTDDNDTSQSEVIGSGTFDVPIRMGTDYTISIELVENLFVFQIRRGDNDWETQYFQTPWAVHPARMPLKALQTRITQDDSHRATISALFDNVKIETTETRGPLQLFSFYDDSKQFVFSKKILEQSNDHITARLRVVSGAACWYLATPNFEQAGRPIGKADVYLLAPYDNFVADDSLVFRRGEYYQLDIDRWNPTAFTMTALDVIVRGIFSVRLEDLVKLHLGKEHLIAFTALVEESGVVSGFDTGTARLAEGDIIAASKNYLKALKKVADAVGHDKFEKVFTDVVGESGKFVWETGIGTLIEIISLPDKYYLLKEILQNYVKDPCPLDGFMRLEAR